jgi:ArsR family transcriptional regulator
MNGYSTLAEILKAIGHPVRIQILETLRRDGPSCVCHLEILLGKRQAYISQQLARLREAGLVKDQREGLNVFYSLAHESIPSLLFVGKQMIKVLAHERGQSVDFPIPSSDPSNPCNCPSCEDQG